MSTGIGIDSLVLIRDLVKHFEINSGIGSKILRRKAAVVHAVDGVSFYISKNETFCIVGESGSGKTTLAMLILRLIEPTSGNIIFQNSDITKLSPKALRALRKEMQIVFQDPSSSLDPRRTILSTVSEPMRAHGKKNDKRVLRERVGTMMTLVGLSDSQIDYYPHQFSGGQRQRIAIARALILQPKLVVLDEPTSALDASVQSQILVLLEKIQTEMKLSYLLVTHNISVARYLADRIAVMYLGKIVEMGRNADILGTPAHPYTKLLISSVLEPSESTKIPEQESEVEIPSAINPPSGCRFNTRCPYAKELCYKSEPDLLAIKSPDHFVACHFAREIVLLEN